MQTHRCRHGRLTSLMHREAVRRGPGRGLGLGGMEGSSPGGSQSASQHSRTKLGIRRLLRSPPRRSPPPQSDLVPNFDNNLVVSPKGGSGWPSIPPPPPITAAVIACTSTKLSHENQVWRNKVTRGKGEASSVNPRTCYSRGD
ncbi:hypothetical protein E2C01_065370 [Portunus trituberculatus]|uniref:Uncharacterized protein n=1 Tax=Portunus trituberculatus TaxID=210409 RepID=A0A5B7HED2_PORTR|nr:hypothetical protein [Portunus trituberculatus]